MTIILLTSNLETMMGHINTKVDRQNLAKTMYIITTTTTTITSCTIEQKWKGYSKVGSWFRQQHWTNCCNCGVIRPNPHVSGQTSYNYRSKKNQSMSCWPKQIWAKFVLFKDPCILTFIKKSSLIVFSYQNIHLMWIFQHNPKNHLISYRYYVYWSWCGQSHCNGILWVPVFGKFVLLSIRYVTDFSIYCEWSTTSLQIPKSPRCVLLWPLCRGNWLQVHLNFEVTSNHYTMQNYSATLHQLHLCITGHYCYAYQYHSAPLQTSACAYI